MDGSIKHSKLLTSAVQMLRGQGDLHEKALSYEAPIEWVHESDSSANATSADDND